MATKHVVTAPLVIVKDDQGRDLYLYQGSEVPDVVSAENIKRLKDDGMIATPKAAEKEAAEEAKPDT